MNVRFRNQSGRSGADQDLIDFDPCCLDDSLPLLGICFQKLGEFIRGGAFDGVCVTFGEVATYLSHDLRWRLGWRKKRPATRQPRSPGQLTRRWSVPPVLLEIA